MRRDDLRHAVEVCVSEGVYPSKQRVFGGAALSSTFTGCPSTWRSGGMRFASTASSPAERLGR